MDGAWLPSFPNLVFSLSSLSSTLAASLLAFWEAFSSCLCSFTADFSYTEHIPESDSLASGLSGRPVQHLYSKAHCRYTSKIFPYPCPCCCQNMVYCARLCAQPVASKSCYRSALLSSAAWLQPSPPAASGVLQPSPGAPAPCQAAAEPAPPPCQTPACPRLQEEKTATVGC